MRMHSDGFLTIDLPKLGTLIFITIMIGSGRITRSKGTTGSRTRFPNQSWSIPFVVGEVGISDTLAYTKFKSSLWLEKGNGTVSIC